MVDCLRCGQDGTKEHRITGLDVSPRVKEGDTYTIIVYHAIKAWWGSRYCRICLYDGNTKISQSGSIKIGAGQEVATKFTGTMPDHSLNLRASLQAEILGFVENCQDAVDIYIKLATLSESTIPIIPTNDFGSDSSTLPSDDDDGDDDDVSIFEWIMDNVVLILGLILIIIIVIKFT